jgi:hypothetical protein
MKPSWEGSRRHEKVTHQRGVHLALSQVRRLHPQVDRPRGPPISHELLMSVLHRLRVSIFTVDQGRFDPRALAHPIGLYKQAPTP